MVELIIIVAILSILATVIVPSSLRWRSAGELERAHIELVDMLTDARERTLNSKKATRYGVNIQDGESVLFEGTVYDANAETNEIHSYTNVSLTSQLLPETTSVVFSRLTGESNATGKIMLTHLITGATSSLEIYVTGAISE